MSDLPISSIPLDPAIRGDVFEGVLVRSVKAGQADDPMRCLCRWSVAEPGDRLVQVYVDGVLAGVTDGPEQRELWVLVDRSQPHRIELLAIDADRPDLWMRSQPQAISSAADGSVVRPCITLLRDPNLPPDARVEIHVDGKALTHQPMWDHDEPRSGFGGLFGYGAFGYDDATAWGLGLGQLGLGPLGQDATAWHWHGPPLSPGTHQLAVQVRDGAGRVVTTAHTSQVAVDPAPASVTSLAIDQVPALTWQAR